MKGKFKDKMKGFKCLRSGVVTALLMILVIIVTIALNLFVSSKNISDIDVTKEKIYSLTQESLDKISSVTNDTKLILYKMSDNTEVINYAKLYNKANSHITYEEVSDALEIPELQEKYGISSSTDSLIIAESGERSKLVSYNDFYTYDSDTLKQLDVTEQKITNAILDVNLSENPKIYFSTNHTSDDSQNYQIAKEVLKNEANEIEDVDLLVAGRVPEDCDVLVITNISEDLTEFERNIIIDYINQGGDMMIMQNPKDANYPNFQAILDLYGASLPNGMMYEQNTSREVGYTNIVIPELNKTSEITKYIASSQKVAIVAGGIINYKSDEELENLGVTKEDLIIASETAYLRKDSSITSQTITQSDQLLNNGEAIASALTKDVGDGKTSRLVLSANAMFVSDWLITLNSSSSTSSSSDRPAINFYKNREFLINSISYLTGRKDNIVLRKDTGILTYAPTAKEDAVVRNIIAILPISIILLGIVVWLIRRRK